MSEDIDNAGMTRVTESIDQCGMHRQLPPEQRDQYTQTVINDIRRVRDREPLKLPPTIAREFGTANQKVSPK